MFSLSFAYIMMIVDVVLGFSQGVLWIGAMGVNSFSKFCFLDRF